MWVSSSLHFISEDDFEGVWSEFVSVSFVELILELHPVKSQSVQEALKGVHAHQNAKGSCKESQPEGPELKHESKSLPESFLELDYFP